MELSILISIAAITFLILAVIAYFLKLKNPPEEKKAQQQHVPANRVPVEGLSRRAQMLRNRGARQRAHAAQIQEEQQPDEEERNVEDEGTVTKTDSSKKVGVKKQAKLEAKAEKKAQREAELQQREEKKQRQEALEAEKKKAEELLELEEKQQLEAELQGRLEKERREHEQYLKMKEAFSVEEEGYDEMDENQQQNLLQEFVSYIKEQKVVLVEDLAANFRLKTQAAIDRIKDLQNDDILTGVIDDRGKFIYVSKEEMEAIARFINQRGKVTIAELAENSNKLINLSSQTTVVS